MHQSSKGFRGARSLNLVGRPLQHRNDDQNRGTNWIFIRLLRLSILNWNSSSFFSCFFSPFVMLVFS